MSALPPSAALPKPATQIGSVGTMIHNSDSHNRKTSVLSAERGLFQALDKDNSGTLDSEEFHRLYTTLRNEVSAEHKKEAALTAEASRSARRTKLVAVVALALAGLLTISVLADALLVNWLTIRNQRTTVDDNGILHAKQASNDEVSVKVLPAPTPFPINQS